MVCTSRGIWLVVAFLLIHVPAFGQSVKETQSESLHRLPEGPPAAKNSLDLTRVKEEILSATNQFRRQQGCRELKLNNDLAVAAQYFANYMARTDKYSHTADGKEPWERAGQFGYAYCIILENIAYDYSSEGFTAGELAQGFMDGWKKSPPHRKNLLDPDVYDIGIGVAHSSRTGRYYAVQDFARPKSDEIEFSITNETHSPVKYTVDGQTFSIDPRYTITYERCRPPELHFQVPKGSGDSFHPRKGRHFVIRKDASGALIVEQG